MRKPKPPYNALVTPRKGGGVEKWGRRGEIKAGRLKDSPCRITARYGNTWGIVLCLQCWQCLISLHQDNWRLTPHFSRYGDRLISKGVSEQVMIWYSLVFPSTQALNLIIMRVMLEPVWQKGRNNRSFLFVTFYSCAAFPFQKFWNNRFYTCSTSTGTRAQSVGEQRNGNRRIQNRHLSITVFATVTNQHLESRDVLHLLWGWICQPEEGANCTWCLLSEDVGQMTTRAQDQRCKRCQGSNDLESFGRFLFCFRFEFEFEKR